MSLKWNWKHQQIPRTFLEQTGLTSCGAARSETKGTTQTIFPFSPAQINERKKQSSPSSPPAQWGEGGACHPAWCSKRLCGSSAGRGAARWWGFLLSFPSLWNQTKQPEVNPAFTCAASYWALGSLRYYYYCHQEINLIDWIEIKLFPDYALFHTKLHAMLLEILFKMLLLYINI